MDKHLFSKYQKQIDGNTIKKREIIDHLEEKTTLRLDERELHIEKRKVIITTTSAKKMFLKSRHAEDLLKEKGYNLFF